MPPLTIDTAAPAGGLVAIIPLMAQCLQFVCAWLSSAAAVPAMGSFFGMTGATLLMVNHPRYSKWGWLAYLVSNGAWLVHASRTSQEALIVQTVYFTFTSIVGAVVWIVRPALSAKA